MQRENESALVVSTQSGVLELDTVKSFMMSEDALTGANVKLEKSSTIDAAGNVVPVPDTYHVVLRRMDTGREYMHPEALADLKGWLVYFVNSGIFTGLQVPGALAPELTVPSSAQSNYVTTTKFSVQTVRFVAIVAVTSGDTEIMMDRLHIRAIGPRIASKETALDRGWIGNQKRTGCLYTYAETILAELHGFQHAYASNAAAASAVMPAMGGVDRSLVFGNDSDPLAKDTVKPSFYGDLVVPATEVTMGGVSIPLVLARISFLMLTLHKPVKYSVCSISRSIYAVQLVDVGGWDIYIMVNFSASSLWLRDNIFNYKEDGDRTILPSAVSNWNLDVCDFIYNQAKVFLDSPKNYPAGTKSIINYDIDKATRNLLGLDNYRAFMECAGLAVVRQVMYDVSRRRTVYSMRNESRQLAQLLTGTKPLTALSAREHTQNQQHFLNFCIGIADEMWRNRRAYSIADLVKDLNAAAPRNASLSSISANTRKIWRAWRKTSSTQWYEALHSFKPKSFTAKGIAVALLDKASRTVLMQLFPEEVFGKDPSTDAPTLKRLSNDNSEIQNTKVIHDQVNAGQVLDVRKTYMSNSGDSDTAANRYIFANAVGYLLFTSDKARVNTVVIDIP